MLKEHKNEDCFDFDVNEAFKMAQPFAFGHGRNSYYLFVPSRPPQGMPELYSGIPCGFI